MMRGMEKWKNVDWLDAGEVWDFMITQGWVVFVFTLVAGMLLSMILKRIFLPVNRRLPRQVGTLVEKALLTLLWVFVVVHALRAVGVDLISVLGAAGVAGIAIGFAAQTVLSNLISGIFIMSERSALSLTREFRQINDTILSCILFRLSKLCGTPITSPLILTG